MSEKYSSEFKAKVALDAVTQARPVFEKVAQKYEITEEEVRNWATQLQNDAATIFGSETTAATQQEDFESENVFISSDNDNFTYDVGYGVTKDDIALNKVVLWASVIVGLVVIMSIGLVYFAQFSLFDSQQKVSSTSPASDAAELKYNQMQELNSFGVVDIDNGIYRVPIDSAINKIAID